MYAVIFKAEINGLDEKYFTTAKQMQALAKTYGCQNFTSVTENNTELAISYWENQEQILNWKRDPQHIIAQELGEKYWYNSWSVEVVEIVRKYQHLK